MKPWLIFLFTFLIFLYVFNFLALNRKFYEFLHWQMRLPIEKSLLAESRKNVLDFIKDKGDLESDFFTMREQKHLQDIKFFMSVEKLFFLAYVDFFLIFYLCSFFFKKMKDPIDMVRQGARYGMILTPVFAVCGLFGFSPLFTAFHNVLFPNDFWLLDYKKHLLINILPPHFFFLMALYFFFISLSLFFCLYFFSSRKEIFYHKKK